MLKTEFSQTYHYAIPGYRMYENWFSTFQKNLVRLIWFFCKQNQTPPYNHLSGKSSSFSFGLPVSTRTSLKIFVKILSSMFMIYLGPVQAFSPLTFFSQGRYRLIKALSNELNTGGADSLLSPVLLRGKVLSKIFLLLKMMYLGILGPEKSYSHTFDKYFELLGVL